MTPIEEARVAAGLTLEQAGKLAGAHKRGGYSPRYIRQIELTGDVSYLTALRLCGIYKCSLDVFLHTLRKNGPTAKGASGGGRKAAPRVAKKKTGPS